MRVERSYCGARDEEVHVLITDAPADGQATHPDAELVCLEIGTMCTGALCPLGATAPGDMVARLIRHGLPTEALAALSRYCSRCDRVTEFAFGAGSYLTCTVCGAHTEMRKPCRRIQAKL